MSVQKRIRPTYALVYHSTHALGEMSRPSGLAMGRQYPQQTLSRQYPALQHTYLPGGSDPTVTDRVVCNVQLQNDGGDGEYTLGTGRRNSQQ